LLWTLLLVVLLASTTSQLVTNAAVEAVRASRQANTLAHELAVDSLLAILPHKLSQNERIGRDLDRSGSSAVNLNLGDCRVSCRVTDDGAKLDVGAFADESLDRALHRKLVSLTRRFDLQTASIALRPVVDEVDPGKRAYLWFDQLFANDARHELFRLRAEQEQVVWSDLITCFGSGTVDIRRARIGVLAVLFDDVDRALPRRIAALRSKREPNVIQRVLQQVDPDRRDAARARISWDLERYALEIDTAIRGDCRRWYVVASIDEDKAKVHYRGQVRW
jgi:hypothetical protein